MASSEEGATEEVLTDVEFEELPQKDTFPGSNVERMPAADLALCKHRCKEQGYGAFVVYKGNAYFRRECSQDCKDNLVDSTESTVYIYKGSQEEAEGRSRPLWCGCTSADSSDIHMQGRFEVMYAHDAFPGKNVEEMSSYDLNACKRRCSEQAYGAFVVHKGFAYFRRESAEECKTNLVDNPSSTVYLYRGPPKVRQSMVLFPCGGHGAGDLDGTEVVGAQKRAYEPLPGELKTEPDGFSIVHGMDAFPGRDADEMDTEDLEACKSHCREQGYGAFVVHKGIAFFRKEPVGECETHLVENPMSTVYLDHKATQNDGFAVLLNKDTCPDNCAEQMPSTDLEACKTLCREKEYGAFVVYRGVAYFRNEQMALCERHLMDRPEATVYLDRGPEERFSFVDAITQEAFERAGNAIGPTFTKQLKGTVTRTLAFVGPKAGKTVVEKAAEMNPRFAKVDQTLTSVDLVDKATSAATKCIMGLEQRIMDFCDDVKFLLTRGVKAVSSAVQTVRKVTVMMMRTLYKGIESAVKAIVGLIPPCCTQCLGCCLNVPKLLVDAFNALVDWLEEVVKTELRYFHVPAYIVEKVDWNFHQDEDPGEPLKASDIHVVADQAHPSEAAPLQVAM